MISTLTYADNCRLVDLEIKNDAGLGVRARDIKSALSFSSVRNGSISS